MKFVDGLKPLRIVGSVPRGVMVKALDCGTVVREFELQRRYYVHFWTNKFIYISCIYDDNTLGKGMRPFIFPCMGYRAIDLMSRVFITGLGDQGSIPG